MILNVDRNVSIKDYAHLRSGELLVYRGRAGIFATIQGEGPYGGMPAVFVRLAGCNKGDKVSCPWCDTAFQYAEGVVMSFAEIEAAIEDEIGDREIKLVVITGGEPTMQDGLGLFCQYWHRNRDDENVLTRSTDDYTIQIESNGDRPIQHWNQFCQVLVVSPKVLPSSQAYRCPTDTVLEQAHCLKFVVSADPTSPYFNVPDWAEDTCLAIYVSPQCVYLRAPREGEVATMWDPTMVDLQATKANYLRCAALALERGFTVSLQKHLFLNIA